MSVEIARERSQALILRQNLARTGSLTVAGTNHGGECEAQRAGVRKGPPPGGGGGLHGRKLKYDVENQSLGTCGRTRSTGFVRCSFWLHETTSAQISGASIFVPGRLAGYEARGRRQPSMTKPKMRRFNQCAGMTAPRF